MQLLGIRLTGGTQIGGQSGQIGAFPEPPSLVDSVNHEELRAIRPAFLTRHSSDKDGVASKPANRLNLHFPYPQREIRDRDAERG